MKRALPSRPLARDQRGTAIMEFALTAPLFLMVLMGILDFSWTLYGKEVLSGAMSQAARASTLEGNALDQSALDASVRAQVQKVFKNAPVTFTRQAYNSFDEIGDPESYTDSNGSGSYDSGECFEDVNGNASWDSDRGVSGNGGADDVVLYTATVQVTRVMPVWRMLGQSQQTTISSTSVLRNQPYNSGTDSTRVICT